MNTSAPDKIAAMQSLKIILLCIVSAIVYGILHDQVTTRICVEYFTIGHPPVFHTTSPTMLAFGWGVIATWWVGVVLGIPAALTSQMGSWPKLTANALIRPIGALLCVMACAAVSAGIAGYFAAEAGIVFLQGSLATLIPVERHNLFLTDLWAHSAAYAVGCFGGLALCVWILCKRRRLGSRI